MHRAPKQAFVGWMCILLCSIALAEQSPTAVTVAYLSMHPRELNGHLVLVRAQLVFGWEGDNFLYDQPGAVIPKQRSDVPARLWFYCDPKHERDVCSTIKYGFRPVLGTFTGYFHFVPDKRSRLVKGVFDPGPWQFSAVEVSDLQILGDK